MAASRSKTTLACDTCRKRKSRCDGIRPVCSYCQTNGLECTYRPTPTNLETDVSILARLADAEHRIAVLEGREDAVDRTPPSPHQDDTFASLPELHTAAAYKMLNCWPRLRLQLTLPGVNAMTYLRDADDSEPLTHRHAAHPASTIKQSSVLVLLERFFNRMFELPFPLLHLVIGSSISLDQVTGNLVPIQQPTTNEAIMDMDELTTLQLLILSIVLRSSSGTVSDALPDDMARLVFTKAMQRHWLLLSGPDMEVAFITLFMASCLLYFWSRPFHALGLLQSIDSVLHRLASKHRNDSASISSVHLLTSIHLLLESDLLTEIDGFPSRYVMNTLADLTSAATYGETGAPEAAILRGHVHLRSCLNQILKDLYTPEKAYAQPYELADVVGNISARLRRWYRSLPLEQQFVRDIITFNMVSPVMSLQQRELALRYLSCTFLLHRPVLYFFLHKEMEYSVRPPDDFASNSSTAPWVLESCRDCIESAVLIVLFNRKRFGWADEVERSYFSWFDIQLLFAAYLIILQVRAIPALALIIRSAADVDDLLDAVEHILQDLPFGSTQVRTSLEILRNERQNFEASSPTYSMGSNSSPFV